MKILHSADWHLGMELNRVSLLDAQKDFLRQLKEIVIEEEVDVILVAGDVYDTSLATREAIELYDSAMHMLCMELKKQVVIIAGNHDSAARLSSCSSLLAPMGLHIYGKIEEKVVPLHIEDAWIYPLPFFHPQTIRRVYGKEVTDEQEAFALICEELSPYLKQEGCHILMAHAFVADAEVSESDRFAQVGGSSLLSASLFSDFDYVALGHLHRPQKIGSNIYYSGSPLPYSFSEAAYEKKVMLFDTKTKECRQRNITPLHPLRTISGSFDEIVKKMQTQAPKEEEYVKIEVKDQRATFELLEYFRSWTSSILQLTGMQEQASSMIGIDQKRLEQMSDTDIVKQFFLDVYGREADTDGMELFKQMKAGKEEEHAS